MAALSRDLSDALDSLRSALFASAEYVTKIPGWDDVSYKLNYVEGCDEDQEAFLCVKLDDKRPVFVVLFCNDNGDPLDERALLDFPIGERVFIAESVPSLIALANARADELPAKVKSVTQSILDAMQ